MSLAPGHKLAHYEILEPIGKGGMGEVYRARDTKLERDVAIKVLPDELAADEERVARFEREAKLLASLNHPNIASIHGFEESALVLELVEGPTLAERIQAGPIPVEEALGIAKQIAEALEAGHEAGVMHRDLKPANIKLKENGTVKVLDYGLAKALEGESPSGTDSELSQSPTLTRQGTQIGVILGTAAYMSPEQAKGKRVDKRTDIWAYGVVLFEMLTGRQAFGATDISQTLALVLTREIDWSSLPNETPPSVRRMLRRCITREWKNRLGDISVARLEIDDADGESEMSETPVLAQPARWQHPLLAVPALVLGLALGGLAVWSLTRPDAPLIVRMPIPLGEGESFTNVGGRAVAISSDGSHIVYSANQSLILRPVDQLQTTPIVDTERAVTSPFFSPDGEWIGYQQEGQLRKVTLNGGAPVTLGEADGLFGASWGEDDTILFGQGWDGIWRVPGAGGTPEQLIAVEEGEVAHGPQMLPGGEWVLFTLLPKGATEWDEAQIAVQSVATDERRVVIDRGRDGRYVPTGHLVYALNAVIMAVPFDLAVRAVTGGPVPLIEGVRQSFGASGTGAAHFSVASTGSLVYVPGSAERGNQFELVWVDRAGQAKSIGAEPRTYRWARVSPDGTRVAVHALGDDNADVWIYDLPRGTLTRLTFDKAFDGFPLWSPDGSRVVFQSLREGGGLFWKAADGTGEVERLLENPNAPRPCGWSADGRLVFEQSTGDIGVGDIGVVDLEGDRTSELIIDAGRNPTMSPDGLWIAYSSSESGRNQVYVRPFPNVNDGKWQVSSDGGFDPLWSPNGRELFFNTVPGLMVSRVETKPTFNFETPERFPVSPGTPVSGTEFDIAPDGERFLILSTREEPTDAEGLVFVQNWFEELKARVPTN